ncbi:MAG TPA: hypothetical protein VK638_16935 [Edaphobacter sp.]|nr:hypothetical protein [Edaphobacter sp.]
MGFKKDRPDGGAGGYGDSLTDHGRSLCVRSLLRFWLGDRLSQLVSKVELAGFLWRLSFCGHIGNSVALIAAENRALQALRDHFRRDRHSVIANGVRNGHNCND